MTKVYFILGCTACGKGAVARELTRRVGGQIVSVDSMKVYRRMDIGTAKPSPQVRHEIPHHCIDVVEPSESFSVAQYLRCADRAISSITAAGDVPWAVGGTSLYIKTLSSGLFEGPPANPQIRAELKRRARTEGPTALHESLGAVDPEAAARIHPNDERRVVRALEVYQLTGRPISQLQQQWDSPSPRYDCVFIALRRDKADLNGRINARAKRMVEAGLADEVASLLSEPGGISDRAAAAVGYAEMIAHLQGKLTGEQALERIKINTRRLAKKQRTWHRRFPNVHWFDLSGQTPPEATADEIMSRIEFS